MPKTPNKLINLTPTVQVKQMLYRHYAGNNKSFPDFVLKEKERDEVSIVNGKCYINKSTALNLFLHWVFEDNGKPVGVKK